MLSQINHLQGQIDQLDKIIGERVEKLGSTLMSIPGVGPTIAGVIHGEIGDVERFIGRDGAEKLVALAGIDPKVKDSGKSKGKVKMSKRGSPYLRHAIRQAGFIAATVSKEAMFEKIYRKQRNKGKALEVALSHVSREMLHVIYALLRDRREYQSTPPKRS